MADLIRTDLKYVTLSAFIADLKHHLHCCNLAEYDIARPCAYTCIIGTEQPIEARINDDLSIDFFDYPTNPPNLDSHPMILFFDHVEELERFVEDESTWLNGYRVVNIFGDIDAIV